MHYGLSPHRMIIVIKEGIVMIRSTNITATTTTTTTECGNNRQDTSNYIVITTNEALVNMIINTRYSSDYIRNKLLA